MDGDFSPDRASSEERERMMHDFGVWLDQALASEPAPGGLSAELLSALQNGNPLSPIEDADPNDSSCDLYSLWSAMTALTQEVRLQGRTFKQLNETLIQNAQGLESASAAVGKAAEEPSERSENVQVPQPRKQEIGVLLDLRERLERGGNTARAAADELAPSHLPWLARWLGLGRTYSRHTQEILTALADGYTLTLDNLDEALLACRVSRIACLGQIFDPQSMNASAIVETSDVPEGTVVEIYRNGYEWNGEVFRTAHVKVARGPQAKQERKSE